MRNTTHLIIILVFITCQALAQQIKPKTGLDFFIAKQDSLHNLLPIEKLYIQTDKPFYTVGDTIWLKAYLFNADYFTNSTRSGLMYIELVNDNLGIASRTMMILTTGTGAGQIIIDGKEIPAGNYTLRAYTKWMNNFGKDYFFSKDIDIAGSRFWPWHVNISSASTIVEGKEHINTLLTLPDAGSHGTLLRDVQLKVDDGNRTLFKSKTLIDFSGRMGINFDLPAKADAHNLSIQLGSQDESEGNRHLTIPLILNRPENTDVQFMPEGGELVGGISTKVAFKAIGENGLGINVIGKIYNSKRELITHFVPLYKGAGSFTMTPATNESYIAEVSLPGGITKTYPLPTVKTSGTVLNIQEAIQESTSTDSTGPGLLRRKESGSVEADSLIINISATSDLQNATLYFMAKSREVVCYARNIKVDQKGTKKFAISKSLFPTGIARLSLLNRLGQPLNDRIVFINHNDNLRIRINSDKPIYKTRDSIALNILVTDKAGNPIAGSFSLAITDDELAPIDSLSRNGLISDLLLTSDLKGSIEQPGYYLQDKVENKQALDNLMLTQGWIGYAWQQVTNRQQQPQYEAEREFSVTGNVTDFFNKAIVGSRVVILSKKPFFTKITKTDGEGNFKFDDFPITDSALYFLEATDKQGKNDLVGINVINPQSPEFNRQAIRRVPWFVNSDTIIQQLVNNTISQRLDEEKLTGENILKEVQIKEKKIVRGSHNLNGPGEADQVLDEKDMEKSGDMTLGELLKKNVNGFRLGQISIKNSNKWFQCYLVGFRTVNLFIDGINVKNYGLYGRTNYYMDNFTAKEIKGIEIMNSVKYKMLYEPAGLGVGIIAEEAQLENPPMFIEITTKAGTGPNKRKIPGTYVYRPLPFNIQKQFYKPKYTAKAQDVVSDIRSTIDWEPNLITDKHGQAIVSFYAGSKPSKYTIIMEGSDMNGNIGSVIKKLKIDTK